MYIYGKSQETAAKLNIKLLKKKYLVYSYFVKSKSDFKNVWNKKGTNRAGKLAKIDIVIINLHGSPKSVEYVTFNELVCRNINALLLLSCNAGHLDYIDSNPATRFYINNNIKQLVCCDGTHMRIHKTQKRWKPTLTNWKRYVIKETISHAVVDDKEFNGHCVSPRQSAGFILYSGKKNGRITSYKSIGYKFKTIMSLLSKIGK